MAQIAASPVESEDIARICRSHLGCELCRLPAVQEGIVGAFDRRDVVNLADDARVGASVRDVAHVELSVDRHSVYEPMGRREWDESEEGKKEKESAVWMGFHDILSIWLKRGRDNMKMGKERSVICQRAKQRLVRNSNQSFASL
jgi:hypothetical protein